jgi:hypothetical protein
VHVVAMMHESLAKPDALVLTGKLNLMNMRCHLILYLPYNILNLLTSFSLSSLQVMMLMVGPAAGTYFWKKHFFGVSMVNLIYVK